MKLREHEEGICIPGISVKDGGFYDKKCRISVTREDLAGTFGHLPLEFQVRMVCMISTRNNNSSGIVCLPGLSGLALGL